jgi:hypothetical protein
VVDLPASAKAKNVKGGSGGGMGSGKISQQDFHFKTFRG